LFLARAPYGGPLKIWIRVDALANAFDGRQRNRFFAVLHSI
jgi:hypothetical protein